MRSPECVVHCDWSTTPSKRWKATAVREGNRYVLFAPAPVGNSTSLLASMLSDQAEHTLIGFDFPIGLPRDYGRGTGLADFRDGLRTFGQGSWSDWYKVVDDRHELSIRRPFYPSHPNGLRRQEHLITALGVAGIDDLRRLCERPTQSRRAACPLFWTLGGNQVGKAAIAGWRDFVIPALRHPGVALWPFDGPIADLLDRATLTIVETYPADAYGQVGIRFAHGTSKRRQTDRRTFAERLLAWATGRGHSVDGALQRAINDGFGADSEGEDRFDAFLGLCGMLEVVGGHRSEGTPSEPDIRRWEGWIFGQADEPHPIEAASRPKQAEAASPGGRPGEEALIARYFAPLAGPGAEGLRDDAASLTPTPGHDLVVTTDAIVAGVHYFPDDPPASIARKALGVNCSDLAAKGATPRGFLLTLALPTDWTEDWLAGFAEGLGAASRDFSCLLLGGDTVRANGAALIGITTFGEVPSGTMVRRQGARPGDRICVSGTIGDAALGLRLHPANAQGWTGLAENTDRAFLIDRYRQPQPRLVLAPVLRRHARAAMDVSDGLAGDLAKMLAGTTARVVVADVPLSDAARRVIAADPALLETALTGGDDYEILCAVAPDALDAFLAECRAVGMPMTAIGSIEAGEGPPVFVDANGAERTFATASFSHF